jgi:hypothetical protein
LLRGIFGAKKEEIREAWRKLCLSDLMNRAAIWFVIFAECDYDDNIKENEMDGTCCTHGRDEKCTQNFNRKI